MVGYIYTLSDASNNVRYVGQTINYKQRIRKHLSDSNNPKTHSQCWINALLKSGEKPQIDIIDTCDIAELDFWEKHYISLYRSWGFRLTNLTGGGFRNKVLSIESRNKISKSLTGRKQSELSKSKRKASLKETWESKELRNLKREQSLKYWASDAKKPVHKSVAKKEKIKAYISEEQKKENFKKLMTGRNNYFTKENRTTEAIKRGAKSFAVYEALDIKRGNRFSKKTSFTTGGKIDELININEAAEKYNLPRGNISKCLKGKRNLVGKLHFKYI